MVALVVTMKWMIIWAGQMYITKAVFSVLEAATTMLEYSVLALQGKEGFYQDD